MTTTIVVTHEPIGDTLFGGSHVAMHISNPRNGEPTLYDPSGSWGLVSGDGDYHRPPSGIFEGGPGSDLDAYIKYETRGDQTVDVFTLETDSFQESQMWDRMIELRDGLFGFECATNVSKTLAEIGIIKETWSPGALQAQLEKLVEDGRATMSSDVDTAGDADNPDQYYPSDNESCEDTWRYID